MFPLDFNSSTHLDTCHDDLKKIVLELTKYFDVRVNCGYRSIADQDKAFKAGNSQKPGGKSKHNIYPSIAVDLYPKVNGKTVVDDRELICFMMGRAMQIADQMGIKIRWGNDWDMDGDISEKQPGKDSFDDLYHLELMS